MAVLPRAISPDLGRAAGGAGGEAALRTLPLSSSSFATDQILQRMILSSSTLRYLALSFEPQASRGGAVGPREGGGRAGVNRPQLADERVPRGQPALRPAAPPRVSAHGRRWDGGQGGRGKGRRPPKRLALRTVRRTRAGGQTHLAARSLRGVAGRVPLPHPEHQLRQGVPPAGDAPREARLHHLQREVVVAHVHLRTKRKG
jgi:hypothetical protein